MVNILLGAGAQPDIPHEVCKITESFAYCLRGTDDYWSFIMCRMDLQD